VKKFLSSFTCLVLMFTSLIAATANAQDWQTPFSIPAVTVVDLKGFEHQYLTAYYAIAPFGAINYGDFKLTDIYVKISDLEISGDSVTIPAQNIFNLPVFHNPNVLVLVIHKEKGFKWVNPLGENPPVVNGDITATNNINSTVYHNVIAETNYISANSYSSPTATDYERVRTFIQKWEQWHKIENQGAKIEGVTQDGTILVPFTDKNLTKVKEATTTSSSR